MTAAFASILGGLKDVMFGRLTLYAILNLVVALAVTGAAAAASSRRCFMGSIPFQHVDDSRQAGGQTIQIGIVIAGVQIGIV